MHTPRIDPPGQPMEKRIKVRLATPTSGAQIYYTTDGSEPTDSARPYEEPFEIGPGTTVKARAYRAGWDPSGTLVQTFPKAKPAGPVPDIPDDAPTLPADEPDEPDATVAPRDDASADETAAPRGE